MDKEDKRAACIQITEAMILAQEAIEHAESRQQQRFAQILYRTAFAVNLLLRDKPTTKQNKEE